MNGNALVFGSSLLVACSSEPMPQGPMPQGPTLPDEVWIPGGKFVMGHDAIPNVFVWDLDFVEPHEVERQACAIGRVRADHLDTVPSNFRNANNGEHWQSG